MRRRDFVLALGGAAAAWPLAARAQQPGIPLVGFLQRSAPIRSDFAHFSNGLAALGYEAGRNIRIEQRYAGGSDARLVELVREVTKLNPAVLVVDGAPTVAAVQAATKTIPIVSAIISDPERFGITNLAKPGGQITGLATFTDILFAKRLELLKEILPRARRVAVLRAPPNLSPTAIRVTNEAGRALGLELRTYDAGAFGTWPAMFATMTDDQCDALLQFTDARFATRITELVILAVAHRLPAVYGEREFVDVGGLASYGISFPNQWSRAAAYVDKILKGANPGDLPVEQPTRFEFVINMSTASALGLAIPPEVPLRADEVIE
jgi:putative tryptophan/tyrosine transport system substrate-binding protein